MSPKPIQNTERINVFLSPEVLDLLKDAALKRGTNVSSLSRFIIMQWLLEQTTLDQIGCEIKAGMSATKSIEDLQRYRDYNRYRFVEPIDE